jgi:hypothetical protein
VIILAGSICPQSLAHRPIFTDHAASGPESAIPVADPAISQVVYREITETNPQVWLTFTVPEGFDLFVQIGVPVLPRLKDFRPALALVGPGLPKDQAPFPLPDGMGILVLSTKEVANPRFFHEHFTGTDSWILRSETVRLKTGGRYFLVAFSPERQAGKLWVAVGTRESFGPLDLLRFPEWRKKVRAFHEVSSPAN